MPRKDFQPEPVTPGFLRELLDSLPAAVLALDDTGTIRYATGQLSGFGDRPYSEIVGAKIGDLMDTSEERRFVESLVEVASKRRKGEMVGPLWIPFGATRSGRVSEVWAVNSGGGRGSGGVVVIMLPGSAYDRYDSALASIAAGSPASQTLAALAEALQHAPFDGESYFLTKTGDDRGTNRHPNRPGMPGPPLIGPWDDVFEGAPVAVHENLALLSSTLREAARQLGFKSVSCFAIRSGNERRPGACLVVWSKEEGKLPTHCRLAVDRAVTIATLALSHHPVDEEQSENLERDGLTGLANKQGFSKALEADVAAGSQPAVILIDLAGLREVNEILGSLAGDAVLRVAARRLSAIMRPTDELARLGGGEFAVRCNGSPNAEQMAMIAARILAQLAKPVSVGDGQTVDVAACAGIAFNLAAGTPVETLLARADHALAQAKINGRGQWAFASSPEEGS